MRFRGIHRSFTVPPACTDSNIREVADGDLIAWPSRQGGWELVAYAPGEGWRFLGQYDDLTDALLDVAYRYGAGPVALATVGEDSEPVALREFLEVNGTLEPAVVAEILKLAPGEVYNGGGGAEAEWAVVAVDVVGGVR